MGTLIKILPGSTSSEKSPLLSLFFSHLIFLDPNLVFQLDENSFAFLFILFVILFAA